MTKGRAERELEDFEVTFRALAHETRRHILVVLNARGRSMTAGEIAARFSCSWPTTSRHLRILQDAGLIRMERNGKEWLYVLKADRLNNVIGGWLKWFPSNQKEN